MNETPRIVTLLPSATEIVCALGFEDQLVGRSHECDFPPEAASKPALIRPRIDARAAASGLTRATSANVRRRNDDEFIGEVVGRGIQCADRGPWDQRP